MDYYPGMSEIDEKTQVGRLLIAAQAKYQLIKTEADLCRHLRYPQQRITNWKQRGIPLAQFEFLADEFDCNIKWLKTGEGIMCNISENDVLSKKFLELNAKASMLDDEDFERVLRFCGDLATTKRK